MRYRSASVTLNYALLFLLALAGSPALACDAPDDLDGSPWRIVVAKVRYLPATEAWAKLMERERTTVQYVVLLDEPKRLGDLCYWPVEIRAEGKVWKRFLVTPDGKTAIEDPKR